MGEKKKRKKASQPKTTSGRSGEEELKVIVRKKKKRTEETGKEERSRENRKRVRKELYCMKKKRKQIHASKKGAAARREKRAGQGKGEKSFTQRGKERSLPKKRINAINKRVKKKRYMGVKKGIFSLLASESMKIKAGQNIQKSSIEKKKRSFLSGKERETVSRRKDSMVKLGRKKSCTGQDRG